MSAFDDTGTNDRTASLEQMIAALSSGDDGAASRARGELAGLAIDRMRVIAHRMLGGAGRVHRWEETDDVVQGALLRLHRALGAVVLKDVQHFLRLAALQVRRELIDLARRHSNPESFAARHETNSFPDVSDSQKVDQAPDHIADTADNVADWSRFHAIAAALPGELRQMFDMVWYLGLSQEEIAQLLNCSTRTVRRRWEEGKQRFKDEFRGQPPM